MVGVLETASFVSLSCSTRHLQTPLCRSDMDTNAGPSLFSFVWQLVDNLCKRLHECGLAKMIYLLIVSPLLRTLQAAVGVFGGEGYTDRMDMVPLMVANAGNSGRAAIPSPNCPPIVAVDPCRDHFTGSSEDTWWKAGIRETKEKVAWGLNFLNWFKVFLMLFLVCPTGARGISNPLIPGSTAMDFLLANKNLRGPSVRRQMRGTEAADDNFNYPSFPHGNSPPNSPANKANPYERPCNPGDKCRQGKGKKN